MWNENNHRWHFDYVRLAWDTGFSFEKNKYPNLDRNKICLVDVDRLIKERDFASIERFIPVVVQYILESDQAEVLDANFVKLFRMSQLTVEYLLFCKKYLDNTVVLLKKEVAKLKDQNNELKIFTRELENHITTLTKHNDVITTFKCELCSKVFSTEEYLSSHINRRHSEEPSKNSTNNDLQRDILQSEIKELKERLNVTEKLLQEREEKIEKSKVDLVIDENKIKVEEIQDRFNKFKEQIENDFKMLQIQKNFYEDKYSKLFDIVMQANNKENSDFSVPTQVLKHSKKKNECEKYIEGVIPKVENTTQTDMQSSIKELCIETVQDRNVYTFEDNTETREGFIGKEESKNDSIEQKIFKFEENIESKISSSLNNIHSQMETFWGRLSELELKQEKNNMTQQNYSSKSSNFMLESSPTKSPVVTSRPVTVTMKPEVKPRSKLKSEHKINNENADKKAVNIEQLKNDNTETTGLKNISSLRNVLQKKSHVSISENVSNIIFDSSVTESELEIKSENSIVEILPKGRYGSKPSVSTIGKQSSIKSSVKSRESSDKFREEINNTLNNKLQEMGISPHWHGIPEKTFEKAMTIVQHQISLAKKMYPNYDYIKKSTEKSLKASSKLLRKGSKDTTKASRSSSTLQPNVINISCRRVSKQSKEVKSELESKPETITIKNRSLYEDTESESVLPNLPTSTSHPLPAYSDVIAELKTTHREKADTDSDLSSLILPKDDIKDDKSEPVTKSVLKSYPSIGSLTKKKVIFDIKTDESNTGNRSNEEHGGGDSQKEKNEDKKDDSLSDFDI